MKKQAHILKVSAIIAPGMVGVHWAEWWEGPFFSDNRLWDPSQIPQTEQDITGAGEDISVKPSNFYYYVARIW